MTLRTREICLKFLPSASFAPLPDFWNFDEDRWSALPGSFVASRPRIEHVDAYGALLFVWACRLEPSRRTCLLLAIVPFRLRKQKQRGYTTITLFEPEFKHTH